MHERLVLRTSGIVILLVAGFHTGFAQLTRPLVNDETIMAAAKARNDGRLLEAKKSFRMQSPRQRRRTRIAPA